MLYLRVDIGHEIGQLLLPRVKLPLLDSLDLIVKLLNLKALTRQQNRTLLTIEGLLFFLDFLSDDRVLALLVRMVLAARLIIE